MKKLSVISAMFFVLAMAGCDNELNSGDDAQAEDEGEGGLEEICDNDIDDDGDGFVDERDPDCQEPDADEDADVEEEIPPGQEICDNDIDDDGDGFVDERDPDCQSDAEEDADEDAVSDAVEDDSVEDVPPEITEDPVEDPLEEDPAEDPIEDDPAMDPVEDDPEECSPTDGELIWTWTIPSSHLNYDYVRAECWARTCDGIVPEEWSWNDDWDQLGGTADAEETDARTITIQAPDPAVTSAEVWCNFVAFNDDANPPIYAVGSYDPGPPESYTLNGQLTVTSGTCVYDEIGNDPEPPGEEDLGPAINFYMISPGPSD